MQTPLSAMLLQTERLIIRPYIESDLTESFELMQHPELFTYMHMDVLPLEAYRQLFQWLLSSYRTPFHEPFKYSFAIRSKASGVFLGWCGVGVLDWMAPEKELYYLIGREHWGNGYAAEAAAALAAYAFDAIGLERLYAKADSRNKASQRVLEKLGFTFDRVLEGLTGEYADCNGDLLHVLAKDRFRAAN